MNAIGRRRLLKLADFLEDLKLKPRQFDMATVAKHHDYPVFTHGH